MQRAFTLLEFLLVVGIMAILVMITLPLSLDFYKNQQLDSAAQEMVQILRTSQLKAMAVERDASFGIYFGNSSYTLFKGDSYVGRDVQYDEVFSLPQAVAISGIQEIVFSKYKGMPNNTGVETVSCGGKNRLIRINELGRINLE